MDILTVMSSEDIDYLKRKVRFIDECIDDCKKRKNFHNKSSIIILLLGVTILIFDLFISSSSVGLKPITMSILTTTIIVTLHDWSRGQSSYNTDIEMLLIDKMFVEGRIKEISQKNKYLYKKDW